MLRRIPFHESHICDVRTNVAYFLSGVLTVTDRVRLRRNPIFAALTDEQCADAFDRLSWSITDHDRGQTLLHQGEAYASLLVLVTGSVGTELCAPGGRVLQVETLAAPEAIASSILFSETRQMPVTVIAETPIRVLHIPRDSLLQLCDRCPQVIEPLLEDLGHRTAFLADRLRMSQFETIRQRLAHYLLERATPEGIVSMRESKKHLAERLGVARPSLFRVIAEFEEDGALQVNGRELTVNLTLLSEAAEGSPPGCRDES